MSASPKPTGLAGLPLAHRHRAVDRPRLLERLDAALAHPADFSRGFTCRLTLVCGPAGFGKTTLVASWLRDAVARGGLPDVAWLSLTADDNDSDQFAASLLARLEPEAPAPAPGTPVLPTLGNNVLAGIAQRSRPLVVVMDDYHLIEARDIHAFTHFFIERLPPHVHLILISRADPPLLLGRMRAEQEINELRARDLRFTRDEVETFLNQHMGLSLAAADITLLERRTEGWIAGLQLAAYSLGREADPAAFLSAFAGNDRYIADYLMEEVLLRLPAERLSFLLQTCILDRLTADLCNAVTERTDAHSTLWALEAANLFLTPLDNNRQWYRYHRLFADLLRQRLHESGQERAVLHRRAADWFNSHHMLPEAVDQALEAGDEFFAMDLMLLAAPDLFRASRLSLLTRWSSRLTDDVVAQRPRLLLAFCWAWIATGHPESAERCVRLYEAAVGHPTAVLCRPAETLEASPLTPELLAGLVEAAAVWSRLYVNRLEIDTALLYCRCGLRVLETLTADPQRNVVEPPPTRPDDWPPFFNALAAIRPVLHFNMGLALKFVNDIGPARDALSTAAIEAQEQGNVHLIALAYGHLAEAERLQGHWRAALDTCARGLTAVQHLVSELPPLAGILLAQEGVMRYELGQTSAAEQLWLRAIELAEPWGNWESLLPAYIGVARLRGFVRRDVDGARDALATLRDLTRPHAEVIFPLTEAYERAISAQMSFGYSLTGTPLAPSALPYLREQQTLCELQALLAAGRHLPDVAHQAAAQAAQIESAGRPGSAVHFYILETAAHLRLGRSEEARQALERALTIAQPEGVTTPFVECGLTDSALWPPGPLAAATPTESAARPKAADHLYVLGPDEGVLEMPSQREREVLRLIAAGMSNREIADRIFVTEGTVKNHAHSLYGKLNVTTRTQAIARARELGLL